MDHCIGGVRVALLSTVVGDKTDFTRLLPTQMLLLVREQATVKPSRLSLSSNGMPMVLRPTTMTFTPELSLIAISCVGCRRSKAGAHYSQKTLSVKKSV